MLHIHNGDAAAEIAKQSLLPGDHFAFREALIEGPTPAEFKDGTWRLVRARHLWLAYGVDLKDCGLELLSQEAKLASFPEHDEVVLWFEHDLFCQTHLIYLLDWFAKQQLGGTKLSLVCIDKFPGREHFRGLGELTPPEFASLFPKRQLVTEAQLDVAASAWRAYCSENPTDIERLLRTDTSALPCLGTALRAHLERFPSTRNGLGRIENRALQLVYSGLDRFSDLFPKFAEDEPLYGLGDAQFGLALRRMSGAGQPLIKVTDLANKETNQLTHNISQTAQLELTELGELVRKDEADFVIRNGIDLWLGGVHLSGSKNLWRWDDMTEKLVVV